MHFMAVQAGSRTLAFTAAGTRTNVHANNRFFIQGTASHL